MAKDNRPGAPLDPERETYERRGTHKPDPREKYRRPFETEAEFKARGGKVPESLTKQRWDPDHAERTQAAVAWAFGASDEMVARMLCRDLGTVQERLAIEKEFCRDVRNLALQNAMFRKAMSGDSMMMIHLSKQWLGMKDRTDQTSNDQPLSPQVVEARNITVNYITVDHPRANPGPPPHLLEATATRVE